MNAAKLYGRIYTPTHIVKIMLDYVNYTCPCNILNRHIIDNSCGDGAFLTEIVRRYCSSYLTENTSIQTLKSDLETYIHGIEIDGQEWAKCKENLDLVAEQFGISGVNWDVINADTLTISQYNGKMDYVVGNPPYVRVHNLSDSTYQNVKRFSFAQGGMTDLFVVFFEIGFNMMAPKGVMCLITPSSWLTSVAGGVLRNYLLHSKQMNGVIDLGHYQPFKATTYSLISRFSTAKSDTIEYNTFNEERLCYELVDTIRLEEMSIGDSFYLADSNTLGQLRTIRTTPHPQQVRVKNGFATLADNVFIGDWNFSGMTINVIKSSTGKWYKCIFPYKGTTPIPLAEIEQSYPDVYTHYMTNKPLLCKESQHNNDKQSALQIDLFGSPTDNRRAKTTWHLFGRTQAIGDVAKDKIAINSVIKDKNSIKLSLVPRGNGVYGGVYILSSVGFETIERIVKSDDYINYIATLKNYKSGGYYTCSAKDIELYINYKLDNNEQ